MRRLFIPSLLALILLVSACSGTPSAPPASTVPAATPTPAVYAGTDPFASGGALTRTDQQGAVIVEVTPLNLTSASDNLEFEVALNTHSVDLSMDLAPLSTLSSDTGIAVEASSWEAPRGGHHVSGTLTFPTNKAGQSILDGTSKLTLTILNVDAASRVFEWDLK